MSMSKNSRLAALGLCVLCAAVGYLAVQIAHKKDTNPPTPSILPNQHHTQAQVFRAVNSADMSPGDNKSVIHQLKQKGFNFPLISNPDVLARYPQGTCAYDKDYRMLVANDPTKSEEEKVIRERGPIRILWVPNETQTHELPSGCLAED